MRKMALLGLVVAAGVSTLPLPAQTQAPRTHQIAIQLFAFGPARIEIEAGDVIEWTNADLAPHTATADDGAWSTGAIKKGATGQFTSPVPGTFAYHCKFHPQMKGVIVVTARP